MSAASSFGPVAPYYDELMRQVPYRMWVGYYLLLLSEQDSHPKSILDVCCGTGTMCEMLTEEKFRMHGIDLSPGMIEQARAKAVAKRLEIGYDVADASCFALGRRFDGALSFFDSLNNVVEEGGLASALRCVAAHLDPGGSFVFDLNTAYAFEQRLFDQKHLKATSKLNYKWVGDWNPATRLITVEMEFWYEGERFVETHVQRAYPEEQVRHLLEAAGFERIRAFHSYTLDKPREKSDRIHYSAIKAG
jgi:SAM-dependent methyltransferase